MVPNGIVLGVLCEGFRGEGESVVRVLLFRDLGAESAFVFEQAGSRLYLRIHLRDQLLVLLNLLQLLLPRLFSALGALSRRRRARNAMLLSLGLAGMAYGGKLDARWPFQLPVRAGAEARMVVLRLW